MNLLVIDSSGMVGHVVAMFMQEQGHNVTGYSEKTFEPINTIVGLLYDVERIKREVNTGKYDAVIYCAAIINESAETDKARAVFINSYLPHFLEQITVGTKVKVVCRSTDCIFSGERGRYTLDDTPDAKSFYARTKAIGEVINDKDITIRTSLIGPEYDKAGTGLFNWFFHQNGGVNGFVNTIWTGMTTLEFARQIEYLLVNNMHGLFQLVPEYAINKYDLLVLFEKYLTRLV